MSIDLTATAGPLKGKRFNVETELLLGRSARGVNLPDPTVSLRHAQIASARDGFTITDLESATGTRLNGDPLPPNRPSDIDLGDEITVGDSVFVVGSTRSRVTRGLFYAIVPAWILLLTVGIVAVVSSGEVSPTLGLATTVRTDAGAVDALTFPRALLREHGLTLDDLALRQVTDLDDDGIDEIWLRARGNEYVLTFGEGGVWRTVAVLPNGCDPVPDGDGDIDCAGALHRRVDGRYVEIAHLGPVVWLQGPLTPPEPPADQDPEAEPPPLPPGARRLDAGKLVPFRVMPGDLPRMAGFLAEHGVTEPAHYILCENVVAGLPAQIVAADGTSVPLSHGCGDRLVIGGPQKERYAGARVAVIGLSAQGRAHVGDHVAYTLSGGEEGLFLDAEERSLVDQLRASPIETQGALVVEPRATPHVFDPTATGSLPARLKLASDRGRPADVTSMVLTTPGDHFLDVPGCGRLQVHVPTFRCAALRGCLPTRSFVDIREVGCSERPTALFSAGFGDGVYSAADDRVEVRVQIRSDGVPGMRDVIHAKVAARPVSTGG